MSENRRTKRLLLRRGKTKDKVQLYADNAGNEYQYKIAAKLASFLNVFFGCLKNGFPIVIRHFWYQAWAFYPFFFVRADVKEDGLTTLNHERIHVQQQRDVHVALTLPLAVLIVLAHCKGWFSVLPLLWLAPFVPTVVYLLEMIQAYFVVKGRRDGKKITWDILRQNTAFEREAVSRSTNLSYLSKRKFLGHLAYTGIKWFRNYGV